MKKIFTLFIFFILIFSPRIIAQSTRIGGINRYETAVNISKSKFSSSKYVVIATGENYPDALCASPYAKLLNAPILLTQKTSLNNFTKQEIQRLNPQKVIIIGSSSVISIDVENSIKNMGIETERIYGNDRYETSIKIAQKINELKDINEIFIASGQNYPDALSSAPIAAIKEIPIILTPKDNLPNQTKEYVDTLNLSKTYVIGGVSVIYGSVLNKLPNAVRIYGKDRFETNKNVCEYFKDIINLENIYIAVGQGTTNTEFADALTGAIAAAKDSTIILLTKNILVDSVCDYLSKYANKNTNLKILGGIAAVSDEQKMIIEGLIASLNKEQSQQNESWEGVDTVLGFTRSELIDINARLTRCQNQVLSNNSKLLIAYTKSIVISLINNPYYDYTLTVNTINQLKQNMTNYEKDEVYNAVFNNFYDFNIEKLLNLRAIL